VHYGLVQTVAPAVEPVSLTEAKTWCRVETADTYDDSLITDLVTEARDRAERITNRQFCTATWVLTLDWMPGYTAPGMSYYPYGDFYSADRGWDDKRTIRLYKPPVQSVVSFQYVDTSQTLQTLAPNLYTFDGQSEPARLAPAYGQIWPVTIALQNTVTITYVAGYGLAAAVPLGLKIAMRWWICQRYEARSVVPDEEAYTRLLTPWWTGEYGP
jgi:hypothetical protein